MAEAKDECLRLLERDVRPVAEADVLAHGCEISAIWAAKRPLEVLRTKPMDFCFHLGVVYAFYVEGSEFRFNLERAFWDARGVAEANRRAECCLQVAAKAGHALAMVGLAEMHLAGKCAGSAKTTGRFSAAAKWLRRAAEQGVWQAAFQLGQLYATGDDSFQFKPARTGFPGARWRRGIPKDLAQAVVWWRRSADLGYPWVAPSLTRAYYNGGGYRDLPSNYETAVMWAKRGMAARIAESYFHMGVCYARGTGVECSLEKATHLWRTAATVGHRQAAFNLGFAYKEGLGVQVSFDEARKWLKQACPSHDIEGLLSSGLTLPPPEPEAAEAYYAHGLQCWEAQSGAIRYEEGVQAFHEAAKLGHARAQLLCGAINECWRALHDTPEALVAAIRKRIGRWSDHPRNDVSAPYTLSAEDAQWNLCFQESEAWYRLAAEQGLPEAQFCLARVLVYRLPSCSDFVWVEWLRKSAEQNFAPAQRLYALMLLLRRTPEADVAALQWLKRAVAQGCIPAQETFLETLWAQQTPEANEEAAQWLYRFALDASSEEALRTLVWIVKCHFHYAIDDVALQWLRWLATQGCDRAQATLAETLCRKDTLEADVEAMVWFQRALAQGVPFLEYKIYWLTKSIRRRLRPPKRAESHVADVAKD